MEYMDLEYTTIGFLEKDYLKIWIINILLLLEKPLDIILKNITIEFKFILNLGK